MGRYNKRTGKQIKTSLTVLCAVLLLGINAGRTDAMASYDIDGYGWQYSGGHWYYLLQSGNRITDWLQDEDGNRYFFDKSGIMQTGIVTIKTKTYLFADDGKLIGLTDEVVTEDVTEDAGLKVSDDNMPEVNAQNSYVDAETVVPNDNVAFYDTAGYGWKAEGSVWNYILKNDIKAVSCWVLDEDGTWFFFDENGALLEGWLDWKEQKYFLDENGAMHIGWLTTEDGTYYFRPGNGDMLTGIQFIDGYTYDFGTDGRLIVNKTGWQTIDGDTYFYDSNGRPVTGIVLIDGVQYGFTEEGKLDNSIIPWNVVLVNYNNSVPENFKISKAYVNGYYVDARIVGELKAMINAAKADGVTLKMTSAYRTIARQEYLYKNALNKYLKSGMAYEKALILTELYHAQPGKSEHNLGLAIDFIYGSSLDESFAYSAAGIWLKEHAHEYGFILRYEEDTTDITHIAYEPWHYRFVGVDVAKHIHSAGVCFEEYFPNYTTGVTDKDDTASEEDVNALTEQDV